MKPIGRVHSPFKELSSMPIQPKGAAEVEAQIEIYPEFAPGLTDLDHFSHVYVIYQFHCAVGSKLRVVPFMDTVERGVFATRSPLRPNPIGLSLVTLLRIEENWLTIKGVDMLDGTPVLDLKPYVARFDEIRESTSGWMQATDEEITNKRSDRRFVE